MKKILSVLCSASLLFVGTVTFAEASEKWGAKEMGDKYRPSRNWMHYFSSTPDVIANGSIASAIDRCDDVVGENHYCVIEIGNNAILPVEIYRSKTKLIGVDEMTPLTSNSNGTFIYIGDDTQKVVIENLNIQGHSVGDDAIYALIIEGKNIKNIMIKNNDIHDFNSDSAAHGIAVYGTASSNKKGIYNIMIEGNSVHDMRTGSSESIVINGNVRRWEIRNNDVYSVNNIAIDAIGGEGTSPSRKDKKGRVFPGRLDAARYGYIEDNYVEDMHTTDNPAYNNNESWAAAIYVDGGHHIHIANNVVLDTPWGYEIGAENCIVSRQITMEGNSAEESVFGDLLLGGYAKKGFWADKSINCNPNSSSDKSEGHGYVRYLTVKENQFQTQESSVDTVSLGYRTTHAIVIQEGVEASNAQGNGSARGDNNAIKITE